MTRNFPEQFVLPCCDIDATLDSVRRVGFRLEMIFPADSPTTAVVSKEGCFVRIEKTSRGFSAESISSLIDSENPEANLSEKRFTKRVLEIDPSPEKAERQLVFSRRNDLSSWERGRAGMMYRDLIPGRLGGSFIGSCIRIDEGGTVQDYVHYHAVRFQIIFCRKGWVKVVYEDQGEPFVLNEGDLVLQPPEIRHRVLECSPGLEVIEISSPAVHATFVENEIVLPTSSVDRERIFNSQKFVRFVSDDSEWAASDGFLVKDAGVGVGTDGVGNVKLISSDSESTKIIRHSSEFLFWYVLNGKIHIEGYEPLREDDSVVIPSAEDFNVTFSDDCKFLEVSFS